MTEESKDVVAGRPFTVGVSGNPGGRPKGSKNKVTLYKLMAEEAVRENNYDLMMEVCRDIVLAARDGDRDCRKLVWSAVMSKGSVDDRSQAQEKVEITINALGPTEKAVVIEQTTAEEDTDEEL